MGSLTNRHPDALAVVRDQHAILDDFASYTDAQLWTKLAADTNTVVAHEGAGAGKSRLKLTTGDATDNNESSVSSTNAVFGYLASRELSAEALVQYTEAATSAANVLFGFGNSFGANAIADNGGAIAETDAAVIFKKDGDSVWSFHTEINNSSTATASTTTAGGSTAQKLRIVAKPTSSTKFEVRPYVNDVQLVDTNGVPIRHVITLGTATDMKVGLYLKAGSANTETLYCDYIYAVVDRA